MYKIINIDDLVSEEDIYISDTFYIRKSDDIYIYNCYNSNSFLYVKIHKECVILTSDPLACSDIDVNYNNFTKYMGDTCIGAISVFNQTFETIPHGYFLRASDLKKIRISNNINYEKNPALCLENVLRKYVSNEKIAISFSGGLDSTAILYACQKVFPDKEIVAFTWWNRGCSNNDLNESERICKDLGVELLKIEIEPEDLIKDIDLNLHVIPNYPAPYLALIGFIEKYIERINIFFNSKDYCIINGVGGDQIFLEAIPFKAIINLNFDKIKDFCELYSLSYYLVFKELIRFKCSKAVFNEIDYRELSIYESLSQTSSVYLKNLKCNFFYPFSTEEIINCSLNFGMDSTFDNRFCRSHFRNYLSVRYKSNDFYRVGKGSMTGAYQKKLFLKRSELIEKINLGLLMKNKIIDKNEFMGNFNLSANGISGLHPKVLLPIIFENCLAAKVDYEKL